MSLGTTQTFQLPEGWTVRKVANALVKEWLPPFRAEPVAKAARWVLQAVVEVPDGSEAPLWEPGISTAEYEERLDRADLGWAIRASAGRAKPIILARLAMSGSPETFQVAPQSAFPETLLDGARVDQFLSTHGAAGREDLFATLLADQGFPAVTGS